MLGGGVSHLFKNFLTFVIFYRVDFSWEGGGTLHKIVVKFPYEKLHVYTDILRDILLFLYKDYNPDTISNAFKPYSNQNYIIYIAERGRFLMTHLEIIRVSRTKQYFTVKCIREEGDIGLFITLVPKVFLFLTTLGTSIEF